MLKYFQWPGSSSEGATISELDNSEVTTMEENTIVVHAAPPLYRNTGGSSDGSSYSTCIRSQLHL